MKKKSEHMTRAPSGTLSRREVLAGAALAALAVSAPAALAAPVAQPRRKKNQPSRTAAPVRRYMAAAAVLGDGRVLVTGGYDRPWDADASPSPLRSAMIYDPASGAWSVARPMSTPRARHAAVALADGRVAVLGGLGMAPTAAVEIYDSTTNTWVAAAPLAQPRYDHSAALCGGQILIIGGSSLGMLSSQETYDPAATSRVATATRSN
jgi:hypothetical protein